MNHESTALAVPHDPPAEPAAPRTPRRPKKPRLQTPGALGSDLKAFLKTADLVLRTIERLAWDARHVAEVAVDTFENGIDDVEALREDLRSKADRMKRLGKTGGMLAQVVAGYRIYGLQAPFVSRAQAERLLEQLHARNAHRFYTTSAEQGGAFLKVGQMLSARSDILPEAWVTELSKLQDEAPALSFDEVRAVLEAELGGPVDAFFSELDEAPIGCASIGQVHRAVTRQGEVVAVKVQRPGIAALVQMDMDLLELFAETMRGSWPDIDYETIVRETRTAIGLELDYAHEANAQERMARLFDGVEGLIVPHVVGDLSTERVLTTRFMKGRKITVVLDALSERADAGDEAATAELSEILGKLLETYLRQVLQFGFFQADPHPGNVLVTDSGEVVLLDYGCTQEMGPITRDRYRAILQAAMVSDRERVVLELEALGFRTRSGRPDTLMHFTDVLLSEIVGIAAPGPTGWPDREEMLGRVASLFRTYEADPVVSLPGEFVMMGRVFGTLGGLFSRYRPDLDFARHVLPALVEPVPVG